MKLLSSAKDGGPESNVTGYWLLEAKRFFSVVLLRFADGTRDAHHDHAFTSVSWLLSGGLKEEHLDGRMQYHWPGILPIITRRNTFHRVKSLGTSWVLSFRGPWANQWHESRRQGQIVTLTHGRKEVA